MTELDEEVRKLLAGGDVSAATTVVIRKLGPEVLGFLCGVVGDGDGNEVFSPWSVRLWRSLATFRHGCSIRTWCYLLARREITRFKRGEKKHGEGRQPISQFEDVLEQARTESRSAVATAKQQQIARLRQELTEEDRMILILRYDRELAWQDIARTFVDEAPGEPGAAELAETISEEDLKREAARLRKRFQLVKERLKSRAQAVMQG
jgi:RNA polymerase sigma-70 factor, ECF subfamily